MAVRLRRLFWDLKGPASSFWIYISLKMGGHPRYLCLISVDFMTSGLYRRTLNNLRLVLVILLDCWVSKEPWLLYVRLQKNLNHKSLIMVTWIKILKETLFVLISEALYMPSKCGISPAYEELENKVLGLWCYSVVGSLLLTKPRMSV